MQGAEPAWPGGLGTHGSPGLAACGRRVLWPRSRGPSAAHRSVSCTGHADANAAAETRSLPHGPSWPSTLPAFGVQTAEQLGTQNDEWVHPRDPAGAPGAPCPLSCRGGDEAASRDERGESAA